MQETTKHDTAPFFPRLAAWLLDRLILGVLLLFVNIPLWVSSLQGDVLFSQPIFFHYTLSKVISVLCCFLYFVLFSVCKGATPGKMAMGLQLIRADGSPISWKTALLRESVGRYLSSFLYIGYLLMLGDNQNRTLHDRIFDTRVIYKSKEAPKPPLRILELADKEQDWYKPYRV